MAMSRGNGTSLLQRRRTKTVKDRMKQSESDVGNTEMDEENVDDTLPLIVTEDQSNNKLKIFNAALNLLIHILIGATVGIALLYSFKKGPMNATTIHIVLCVLGYQLLMAQAILCLSPHNSWSSSLKLLQKRQAHWILQILGSALAIAGSFVKILDKTSHWNTLHGQFALVALVFTVASLVNGITSLYAYELRRIMPGTLSKITHIIFGTVAFGAACISLCYGFDKGSFRKWASAPMAATVITFTATFTFIIIVNPLVIFVDKTLRVIRR
ncbi:uncharacterized protein LOC128670202 [Plodia interpunctella]|uniref:uncharacterized protein LOC128670202 n=1 Tax=Plodia interpunctella TaxID=58824 RepID=UPI0023678A93|nr:uncharacterized protein LOC128670202 [Plodia interpunctella]XP_053601656.1 uncharacterized protein LOC128670202 [Plodia interpunctella]XP_053601657.1 uncharacterized protein LOC128670202 [Plodia interpunctella]